MRLAPLHHPPISHPVPVRALQSVASNLVVGHQLTPAQVRMAAVILSQDQNGRPEHPFVSAVVGRRSGKTSVILSALVTLCQRHPGIVCYYSALTLMAARERLLEVDQHLQRSQVRGYVVRLSQGGERLTFSNGSTLKFVAPREESFRGQSADVVALDEAQGHVGVRRQEMLASVLPILDTRPNARLIVAGTAGRQDSLLGEAAGWARTGTGGWAGIEYAAAQGDDLDDPQTWWRVHLGLNQGLTVQQRLEANRAAMGPANFAAEYLGVWLDTASAAFSEASWDRCGTEHADMPAGGFWFGYDVAPNGERASVVAGYVADGHPRVELVDTRKGTSWVAPYVVQMAVKHQADIGYDSGSRGCLAVADEVAQLRANLTGKRPKLRGLTTSEFVSATSRFSAAVIDGRLRHARQPELTHAVVSASRRTIGQTGFGYGRTDADISPLVAANVAFYLVESTKTKARPVIVSA